MVWENTQHHVALFESTDDVANLTDVFKTKLEQTLLLFILLPVGILNFFLFLFLLVRFFFFGVINYQLLFFGRWGQRLV